MRTAVFRSGVPYLLVFSFVGRLPSSMAALAFVRLIVGDGLGYAFASIVTALYILGGMAGQPVLARFVDRSGRRRPVLFGAALVATAAFVVMAIAVPTLLWLAAVAAFTAGFATPPLESVLRSLWPAIFLDATARRSAYAVDAAVQELAFVFGPLFTASGILLFGVSGNVLAMAGIGLVGTLVFAAHPRLRRVTPTAPHGANHGSPLARDVFRRLLLLVIAIAAPVGALTITATAYAERSGEAAISSWAIALNGLGALTGALVTARFPLRAAAERLLRPLGLALAILYLTTAFATAPIWLWLTFAGISGLALPVLLTQVFTHTPAIVMAAHSNEANAWVISAFAVGNVIGTILAGQAIGAAGAIAGIPIAALSCGAIAILGAAQAGAGALRATDAVTDPESAAQ